MLDGLPSILSEIASATPAPGGGTAAAISGGLSAALGSMITKILLSRERYKDKWDDAKRLSVEFDALSKEFRELAEQDAQAFLCVVEESRKKQRGEGHSLTAAERRAALVPLRTAERAVDLLKLLAEAERLDFEATTSDLFVALMLAKVAFAGGKANVFANIPLLEPALAQELRSKIHSSETEFEKTYADIKDRLVEKLGLNAGA